MTVSLEGQVVLVTGANRGLGREFVEQLLARGAAKVYAAARQPDSITSADPRVVPLRLDVTDPDSVARAAAAATRRQRPHQQRRHQHADVGAERRHRQPAQ